MVYIPDQMLLSCDLSFTPTSFHIHAPNHKIARALWQSAGIGAMAMQALKLRKASTVISFPEGDRPYQIPARMAFNAMVSPEKSQDRVKIQEAAQQELETYLEEQAHAIAPAPFSRVDVTANYTYLSAIDEDRPTQARTRLMVKLEDSQGNEHLVDLVTNNDGLIFLTRIIRNTFDPCWNIAESWTPAEPF